MPQRQVIETAPGGLRFELEWRNESPPGLLTLGSLTVHMAGVPVWPAPSAGLPAQGISGLWIELLEFLGDSWSYLTLEQGYPFDAEPSQPSKLDDELARRWENTPDDQQEAEEEIAYAFKVTHNLARASAGTLRPDLWLVRDGGVFVVEAQTHGQPIVEHIAANDVRRVLVELGDAIAERLRGALDERSLAALTVWSQRDKPGILSEARLVTGLPSMYLTDTAGTESLADVFADPQSTWAGNNAMLDTAYRFKGRITPSKLRAVLRHVKTPLGSLSDTIQSASAAALSELARIEASLYRPYRQGSALAGWLRSFLNAGMGRVEPKDLLSALGASVEAFDFDCSTVDAMAYWAHRQKPRVLWNSHQKHSTNEGALRATLAHEICHLLVDRTALPIAAVVGGAMERRLEQRANAFAAEFLCPKNEAGRLFDQAGDVQLAIEAITSRFGVSNQLAALQLARSRYHSDPSVQRAIEGFGPDNASYPWTRFPKAE